MKAYRSVDNNKTAAERSPAHVHTQQPNLSTTPDSIRKEVHIGSVLTLKLS